MSTGIWRNEWLTYQQSRLIPSYPRNGCFVVGARRGLMNTEDGPRRGSRQQRLRRVFRLSNRENDLDASARVSPSGSQALKIARHVSGRTRAQIWWPTSSSSSRQRNQRKREKSMSLIRTYSPGSKNSCVPLSS